MGGQMFEELDYRETPIGALSLRRRRRSAEGEDIYEIRLDDGHLMTSLFTEGEIALAELGLAGLDGAELSVVVGGLGLGYTAKAALDHGNVGRLVTVEANFEVIEWHRAGLLPLGEALASDPRCRFVHGDFYEPGGRVHCKNWQGNGTYTAMDRAAGQDRMVAGRYGEGRG